MAKQTFNYSTSSVEACAKHIIAWAREGDVGATATVQRGLDHTRAVMDACNAGSLDKDQVTRVCNAFKQACNRLNLAFTVGTKKESLIVTPRTVVEKSDKTATDKTATDKTATDKTATDKTATDNKAELATTKAELANTKAELAKTKAELAKARKLIAKLQAQLDTLKAVSVPALAEAA